MFYVCFVCTPWRVSIPSSCGIFLHKLVTSIKTSIMFSATFVFPMKLMKSVLSLYDFCFCAVGWRSLSTNTAEVKDLFLEVNSDLFELCRSLIALDVFSRVRWFDRTTALSVQCYRKKVLHHCNNSCDSGKGHTVSLFSLNLMEEYLVEYYCCSLSRSIAKKQDKSEEKAKLSVDSLLNTH